jgi:hypothetical protein
LEARANLSVFVCIFNGHPVAGIDSAFAYATRAVIRWPTSPAAQEALTCQTQANPIEELKFGRIKMRPKSTVPDCGLQRRPWQPPRADKIPLRVATRSQVIDNRLPGSPTRPTPLTVPSSKLGFSFEWSLPLSIRTED